MSCQQLIQEDPYIFTDTISNSTNFMHENNSQTKYVPLNRQTIYNRQFRQHEPSITSTIDLNSTLQKSTKPANFEKKIVISPINFQEKRNGFKNGNVLTTSSPSISSSSSSSSSSPRTSPKFFKTHQPTLSQQQNDEQFMVNVSGKTSNSTLINHSIASQSVSKKQLQLQNNFQLNHVAESIDNGISNTGIKQEISESDVSVTNGIVSALNGTEFNSENCSNNDDDKSEKTYGTGERMHTNKTTKHEKSSLKRSMISTHVRSQNVVVEPISDVPRLAPQQVQLELNVINKYLLQNYTHYDNENFKHIPREDRLNMRKIYLRHALEQYNGLLHLQKISFKRSKINIKKSQKILKRMDRSKEQMLKKSIKLCYSSDCKNEAVTSSDYCIEHILSAEKEQYLVRQCCFLHIDGQQCRVPVFDVLATVAVCNDHLNAPAHQIINDVTKPKKNQAQRKRTKATLIRPVKKNNKVGRKKKITTLPPSNLMIPAHRPTMIIHPNDIQKQPVKNASGATSTIHHLKPEHVQHENNQFIHHNSGNLLASSQSSYGSLSSGTDDLYLKQDLMTAVCENSYESSEDTGVGGLSENELISHDVIGNFDMESCAELSKVLNSLPSNALDDLLTEPLHTSRDDEEYLDRAIEEVSVNGMDQMDQIAITAFEHLEGLDMFEMDDEEQRQIISAATNLISMSGYLSHDQDNNYSAMPSPMMS